MAKIGRSRNLGAAARMAEAGTQTSPTSPRDGTALAGAEVSGAVGMLSQSVAKKPEAAAGRSAAGVQHEARVTRPPGVRSGSGSQVFP